MTCGNVLALMCLILGGASDSTSKLKNKITSEWRREDVMSTLANASHIAYLRGENVEKPYMCRQDVCWTKTVSTEQLGDFTWPTVTAGYKVTMLCPYSYATPLYTSRTCQLAAEPKSNVSLAEWAEPDTSHCPTPPTNEMIKEMENDQFQMSVGDHGASWTFTWVQKILDVAEETGNSVIYLESARVLNLFLAQMINNKSYDSIRFTDGEIQQILQTFDLVYRDQYPLNTDISVNAILNLANQFPVPAEGIYESRPVEYNFMRKPVTEKEITLSGISDRHKLNMDVILPEGAVDFTFKTVVFKRLSALLFYPDVRVHMTPEASPPGLPAAPPADLPKAPPAGLPAAPPAGLPEASPPDLPKAPPPGLPKALPLGLPTTPPAGLPTAPPAGLPNVASVNSSESECQPLFPPKTSSFPSPRSRLRAIASLIDVTLNYRIANPASGAESTEYLNSDCQQNVTWEVTGLRLKIYPGLRVAEEIVCIVSPADERERQGSREPVDVATLTFYTGLCDTVRTLRFVGNVAFVTSVTCHCRAIGYITIVDPGIDIVYSAPPTDAPEITNSFEETMGFPFNYSLFLASLVLGSVSAVCLILTILSYTIFSKLRRGSATRILLNLCVCILLTLVFMYVSLGLEFTKPGWKCCLYTSLKYYLVLVTLMWNGVEGVNMYLKLVKVFHGEMIHFVRKAAGAAYGLPVVVIGIIFAVDHVAFRGTYEGCKYRCVLTPDELYFAYLIPLLLIMVANLILFIVVMVTISRSRPGASDTRGQVKRYKARIIGAVSMLFLLGFPWLFSAFGALDASANEVTSVAEEVFQIIFMVLISLQGLFIFLFNCVRQARVRKAWASSVISRSEGDTYLSDSNVSTRRVSAKQKGVTSSTFTNVTSSDMMLGITPAAARENAFSSFKIRKTPEVRVDDGNGHQDDVIGVSLDVIEPEVNQNDLFDHGVVNHAFEESSGSEADVNEHATEKRHEVNKIDDDVIEDNDRVGRVTFETYGGDLLLGVISSGHVTFGESEKSADAAAPSTSENSSAHLPGNTSGYPLINDSSCVSRL